MGWLTLTTCTGYAGMDIDMLCSKVDDAVHVRSTSALRWHANACRVQRLTDGAAQCSLTALLGVTKLQKSLNTHQILDQNLAATTKAMSDCKGRVRMRKGALLCGPHDLKPAMRSTEFWIILKCVRTATDVVAQKQKQLAHESRYVRFGKRNLLSDRST